jgi:hypothetical protein
MEAEKKAKELVDKFSNVALLDDYEAKQCALIAVENEYHSLREQLFNLRSCHVIESEKVYLFRLNELIEQEKEVKQEIEKL